MQSTWTFARFLTEARARGFTHKELRCDVPVTPELLDFMCEVGMSRYERFVGRLDALAEAQGRRLLEGF